MNQRIKAIVDASTVLFLQQGYTKTQISHIAKAIGVSVGTIYHDFAGKQEIMHFVLKCTIDPEFSNREFKRPITDDIFGNLEDDIVAFFDEVGNDFAKNLNTSDTNYTFEELISDAFDLMERYAVGCLFIEKNQFDFKFLAEYYKAYRKRFFHTMSQYLNYFIQKKIVRPLEHIDLTTTMIIEILSWWAMDMRFISFERYDITANLAKQICMDNILAAYKQ